jgi:hypothetical protein
LIGCSGPAATPTRIPFPTPSFPTPVPLPTSAPTIAPTATPSPIPSPTVYQTPTRAPTLASGMMRVKLFFIALEDNGKSGKKIGCNDSVIAVDYPIPATQSVLTASLKELFSLKDRNYGQSGLVNALAPAQLQIKEVSIISGKANINLTGTLSLGGACDAPRVKAQIEETALQFSTVKSVSVTINGLPLDQVLSGKGN